MVRLGSRRRDPRRPPKISSMTPSSGSTSTGSTWSTRVRTCGQPWSTPAGRPGVERPAAPTPNAADRRRRVARCRRGLRPLAALPYRQRAARAPVLRGVEPIRDRRCVGMPRGNRRVLGAPRSRAATKGDRTVNDEDLTRGISRAVADRMARLKPKPDVQKVLQRLERNATRNHGARWADSRCSRSSSPGSWATRSGSAASRRPSRASESATASRPPRRAPPIDPEDSASRLPRSSKAFHDAYDGGSPHEQRNGAVQDGKRLESLRAEAIDLAVQRGFLAEQLARETIEVHDVSLVDRTHAIVRFTISIPPRGPLLVDQIGYAVQEGGRWKVSLRTACDLLSLGGLGKPCPPP